MSKKTNKNIVGELGKKNKSFWSDFKKFITKGNIIDLAVAVVIGGSFNKIVSSLVKDIITPITGFFIVSGDIAGLKWILKPAVAADDAAWIAAVPEVAITYGVFLQNIIDFLVIAFVVFLMVRIIMKIKSKIEYKAIEAAKAKAKADEEKKKEEATKAAAEAERQANIQKQFYADVAAQASILAEIRDLMLKSEGKK